MSNVINIGAVTYLDMLPDQILQEIDTEELDGIVLIGFKKNGDTYFKSSYADGGTVLWLLEHLKRDLLSVEVPPVDL